MNYHVNIAQRADCPVQSAALLFFDIETTGLYPSRGARITEVAVLDRDAVLLSWKAETNANGDTTIGLLSNLLGVLRTGVVVGHNVLFDLGFVAYQAERCRFLGPRIRFIDTLEIAHRALSWSSNYQLPTLLNVFRINPPGEHHSAVTDASATRSLFWKMVEHASLKTLADAHMKQLDWSAF